jgi:hypothetical protein
VGSGVRYRSDMSQNGKGRLAGGLLALAALYVMAVYVIPGFVGKSEGQGRERTDALARQSDQCTAHPIKHRRVPVENGQHSGEPWSVIAGIKNGHACGYWSLSMEFRPQDVTPGSWEGLWEIPAGGHLPASATMSARDETTGKDRDVSGIVGWHVRTVVFRTRGGRRFVVHPKAPEARLLKRYVWLRNLRYFLRFYPIGDPVKVAKLLDYRGATIETVHFRLGEYLGIP